MTRILPIAVTLRRCAVVGVLTCLLPLWLPAERGKEAPSFDSISVEAAQAKKVGQSDIAIEKYRAALALRPSWAEGWWNLGSLYYGGKQYEPAVEAFRRLTLLAPRNGLAWALMGLCEFELGRYAASLQSLNRSGQIGFGSNEELPPLVIYHIALLLTYRGDFELSLDQLALFVSAGNHSDEVVNAIGMATLHMRALPSQVPASQLDLVKRAGEAAFAFQGHEVEKARELFAELVSTYPDQPNVHYAYGMYLLESDPQQAYEEFRKELQISPRHVSARLQVAFSYLQQGEPEQALTQGQAVVKVAPEDYRAYLVLGRAYLQLGQNAKALVDLRRSAALAPKDSETHNYLAQAYLKLGNKAAATSEQSEFQRLKHEDTRQSSIAGWWYFAGQYYDQHRYPEARDALRKITEQNPGDGAAWAIMGFCEFNLKDYSSALEHLRKARHLSLENNPQVGPSVHLYLSLLLDRAGQFDDALTELSALAHAAPDTQMLASIGINTLRMKLLPEEIPVAQADFVAQVGRAAWSINSGKWSDATQQFADLEEAYPDQPYLHYEHGVCLAHTGLSYDAMKEFQREIELSPKNVDALSQIVFIDLKQGRREDALETAERAVELAPDRFLPHNVLGWALLANHQIAKAVEEMAAAARLAPDLPVSRFSLAQAYKAAGRSAEADREMAEYETLRKQQSAATSTLH